MASSNERLQVQIKGEWGDPRMLDVTVVDELQYQETEDRCYLTFGQVRLPSTAVVDPADVLATIQPVARIVLTKNALTKMLSVLNESMGKSK